MTKKRVTTADIAREAGVSIATVSYILNDRKDVKVAEATRKKVLQICNLMEYVPSQIAKSLATGRNNIIGIQFNLLPDSLSRNLYIFELIKELQSLLQAQNYDTLIMPAINGLDNMRIQRNIDGIICIDLPEAQFHELKESYFVPIILIDMVLDDDLFYRTFDDIPAIYAAAKKRLKTGELYFIMEKQENESYINMVRNSIPPDKLHIVCNKSELQTFLKEHNGKHFVIYGKPLALLCLPFLTPDKVSVVCGDSSSIPEQSDKLIIPVNQKASVAVEMLKNAVDRKEKTSHEVKFDPSNP